MKQLFSFWYFPLVIGEFQRQRDFPDRMFGFTSCFPDWLQSIAWNNSNHIVDPWYQKRVRKIWPERRIRQGHTDMQHKKYQTAVLYKGNLAFWADVKRKAEVNHLIFFYRSCPAASLVQTPGGQTRYFSTSSIIWECLVGDGEQRVQHIKTLVLLARRKSGSYCAVVAGNPPSNRDRTGFT